MKVLNFGSLNLDFVYTVNHFVREGETLSSLKREEFCGGKGLNQSVALARAGAKTYHAGTIGYDGEILLDALSSNGVDISFVQQTKAPTGHAIIQRDLNGQNCILLYNGANYCVTTTQIDMVLENFSSDDYLVLQNEINLLKYIMVAAKERGMRIVFNPSPMDEKIRKLPLELVDYFILNEIEAMELCGNAKNDSLIKSMHNIYPKAAIVLTLGKQGVMYIDNTMPAHLSCSAFHVANVIDTTAAGDTFTGYFIAGIMHGRTVNDSLIIASKAAAIAVSRPGAMASIPTMEEVAQIKCDLASF